MVSKYEPKKYDSNLYCSISSLRKEGVAPASEADLDYAYWKNKISSPISVISDEELLPIIYEQSREIDNITQQFFYSNELKIAYRIDDLYSNYKEMQLPTLLTDESLNSDLQIFKRYSDGELFELDPRFPDPAYKVYGSPLHLHNPHIRLLSEKYKFSITIDSFENETALYSWLFGSAYSAEYIIKGTFGYLENGSVPLGIQTVCKYLVKRYLSKIDNNTWDEDRSMLRSETTDKHSYELADLSEYSKVTNGFFWTGNSTIDNIISRYIKITPIILEVV